MYSIVYISYLKKCMKFTHLIIGQNERALMCNPHFGLNMISFV